jgi:hypothetical protein
MDGKTSLTPNKTSGNIFYKNGIVLLGLNIIFVIINNIFFGFTGMYSISIRELLLDWWPIILPLIILFISIFLVRKYPIIVGVIFLCVGVILSVYWIMNPIQDDYYGLYYILIPPVLLFILDGILFLISGLTSRKNRVNEVLKQQ